MLLTLDPKQGFDADELCPHVCIVFSPTQRYFHYYQEARTSLPVTGLSPAAPLAFSKTCLPSEMHQSILTFVDHARIGRTEAENTISPSFYCFGL